MAQPTRQNFLGEDCGIGPAELLHSIYGLAQAHIDTPLIAKGNCGTPSFVDCATQNHGTPALMADCALFARNMGVRSIGGYCRTSPDRVEAISQALAQTLVRPFDEAAMQRALGQPSANIPENLVADGRRKSRQSRRK